MTTAPMPICMACARLGPGPDGLGYACAAYPDAIPDSIFIDGADHRRAQPGDGGVRFELAIGADDRLAAYEAAH